MKCEIYDTLPEYQTRLAEIEALPVVTGSYASEEPEPLKQGPHEGKYALLLEPEVLAVTNCNCTDYDRSWKTDSSTMP